MKKEEFVTLGITEDMAEKAAEASKKELEGFVPRTRFNDVNEAKRSWKRILQNVTRSLKHLGSPLETVRH